MKSNQKEIKEIEPIPFLKRFKQWYFIFLLMLTIGTIGMSLGVGFLLSYVSSLPPIEQLENYAPAQMTEVFDKTGKRVIAKFYQENREVVAIKDVPKNLLNAFVAIEDERFFEHFGIDIKRILGALIVDIKRMRLAQGASTITQQLPRNLLKNVSREKTLNRKIKETILALKIESTYSKEQILEFYLNQIFLGKGSYGIKAAAKSYFNKDLADLTLAECATIAAIPQKPALYSPIRNPKKSLARRNIVLKSMLKNGFITQEEYKKAIEEKVIINPPDPFYDDAPYFVDYLRRQFSIDPDFASEDIKTKGFKLCGKNVAE